MTDDRYRVTLKEGGSMIFSKVISAEDERDVLGIL
jgi:hypothetical protein